MKALPIFALALLASCATGPNEQYLKQLRKEGVMNKRFDFEAFDKHKKKLYEHLPNNTDLFYEYTGEAGVRHRLRSSQGLYYETVTHPDSLVSDIYTFYPDGALHIYTRRLINRPVNIGKRVDFDRNGKVIKVFDYETDFPFSLSGVQTWMKANGIDAHDKDVSIYRGKRLFNSDGYVWVISIDLTPGYVRKHYDDDPPRRRIIELSGATGEVLSDEILNPEEWGDMI